ncbi:acyl carrier protein [Hymenobacter psoromatis]|uniref:acyl carrier protein n=1 Tax=Hymenobacter psoromatis TaxID=1484116 RepID=UPI001CBB0D4F|nr:acyl carrier protein [Hymenobacter psoromatis]
MDVLQEKVFEAVRKQAWHRRDLALTLATKLADELEFDLLARVQLGIRLEYSLRIEIPDTQLGQWRTVADVLACVRRQLPTGSPTGT